MKFIIKYPQKKVYQKIPILMFNKVIIFYKRNNFYGILRYLNKVKLFLFLKMEEIVKKFSQLGLLSAYIFEIWQFFVTRTI